ncbi:MAG: hypothetical protein R3E96_00015 [Planctomycetota bacterium]
MLRLPLRPARFLAALCLPLLIAALARPQGALVSDDFDTRGGLQLVDPRRPVARWHGADPGESAAARRTCT